MNLDESITFDYGKGYSSSMAAGSAAISSSAAYTRQSPLANASTVYNNVTSSGGYRGLEQIPSRSYVETQSTVSTSSQAFVSSTEAAILRSVEPLRINESEEITVNGERGVWTNKQEVSNWRGNIPITQYQINQDPNPQIIRKQTRQTCEYIQELAVRYLKPPTPPPPGEIIINQMANVLTPPAPPIIIRQQPPRPATPEPIVIREAPPAPPPSIGRKVITISGKRIPPPPRKVIVERLPPMPAKPQSVLVERWLPYAQVKRRVIFNRANQRDPVMMKPRNVIIQWEPPKVSIKKQYRYLGVIRANPADYVQRYGPTLKESSQLPQFVLDIKTPPDLVLAANHQYNDLHELYGDVDALRLVDLEREGLGQYRNYLQRLGINTGQQQHTVTSPTHDSLYASQSQLTSHQVPQYSPQTVPSAHSYTPYHATQLDSNITSTGHYSYDAAPSATGGIETLLENSYQTTELNKTNQYYPNADGSTTPLINLNKYYDPNQQQQQVPGYSANSFQSTFNSEEFKRNYVSLCS